MARPAPPPASPTVSVRPVGLATVATLAILTAVACAGAAAAEWWRFSLLLTGRSAVLDRHSVVRSDELVAATSMAALILGVVTGITAALALTALYRAAAHRAGRRPARSTGALLARLLVPWWNLYGAGQVLTETARLVGVAAYGTAASGSADDGSAGDGTVDGDSLGHGTAGQDGDRRGSGRRGSMRVTVPLWWVLWVINGVLATDAAAVAWGSSRQALANGVELHIAVDIVAVLVASVFAMVVLSLRKLWLGRPLFQRSARRYDGWVLQSPSSPTKSNGHGSAGPRPADRGSPRTRSADTESADTGSADTGAHTG